MSLNVDASEVLAQAKARQEAAIRAKEEAEKAKTDAAAKDAEAAALAEKESLEATEAAAAAEKEAAEVAAAQEKVNSANVRVTSAQAAYANACSQLNSAQGQLNSAKASGDESAIAAAESAVNSAKAAAERAYQELQTAQQEAETAQKELEKETTEAEDAKKKAELEKTEAEKAAKEAEAAKNELAEAETVLADAAKELEAANAAVSEAEAAVEAEEANAANETEGVQEAEHLSQEEIDKLVQEEGYTYITSKDQFLEIFQNGGIDLNGSYILGCDIDLSEIENWQPVGDEVNPFTGVFNGNGYSIDNLTINVEDSNAENVGFFGTTVNAEISNVNFTNASIVTPSDFINGSSSVGIVAGTARGTSFDNITISGDVTGYESVGGMVGVINDNSYYDANENYIEVGNSSISNVDTSVDASGKYYVGGLVGSIEGTEVLDGVATRDLVISNCNTSGDIVFDEESAGGLIGEAGKTVVTITNSESNVNLTWNNTENDGDISFLMETGRAGGFIGCANGTYIAICNSEYNGNLDVEGDFKGEWYGWYMNDAHVTTYEIPGGLPVDDILNIEGIDALEPVTDPSSGISHYEVTVSTLTGLDKMVTMLYENPALAEMITFNVNFDFEAMDGMYDSSVYAQYGVTQHLYEDEEGTVHNDVYIDNEIDLETTFHNEQKSSSSSTPVTSVTFVPLKETMVSGLYKDEEGKYVVIAKDMSIVEANMSFNYDNQVTDVTKRLQTDEVRFREYITDMVKYYQSKMNEAIKALFEIAENKEITVLNKAEYKKLIKMQEAGMELSNEQKAAIALYEVDYQVMNLVAETTHNKGCGMGGDASFLDETTAIQMFDDAGRPLFTTLNGDQLRQRMDEEGNLMTDDEGNPVYENLDGSDYTGLAEVFAQRGYPVTDEEGNFLYTDKDGNSVTKSTDEEGNTIYTNADGTAYEGAEEDLTQQLEPFDISEEYKSLENEMKDLLDDVESGNYGGTPLDNAVAEDNIETAVQEELKEELKDKI